MQELIRVVGLDLSLTSTGMSDGQAHVTFTTTPDECIEDRLMRIREECLGFVMATDDRPVARLVVVEDEAWSKAKQTGHAELSALRLMVRCALRAYRIPFAMVPPSTLKLYTTGNGRATKQQMAVAVTERHGIDLSAVKVKDGRYDQVDAAALAAMGYAYIGQPLPTQGPPAPMRSMLAVDWPDSATALQLYAN